jgi:glycerol-3-phosphate dehydrogenase subunit B
VSHHDVVVVGTGLAGLTAAVRLAEGGARVLVLAQGVGATHLSAGTIDILGYAPERVERPAEALRALVDAQPGHPYALVGADAVPAAVEWFKARIAAGPLAPYAYTGSVEENLLLPTAAGVPRPSAVVPETMAGGDLRRDAAVCIVGFRALKDFYPALAADMLIRAGVQARSVELELVPEGRADVNPLGFARAFDDPAFRADVTAQLVAQLGVEERAAFPAVLGIADPHGAWTELEHRLGGTVFEIPTLPPSVPGIRVHKSLTETLRRAGGRVILNVVVTGAEHEGGRVSALRTRVGLPVTGVPEPGAERFRPGYFDDHPMARAGVAVDRELRPVDSGGDRLYENVLVAGATLAGGEPWREKSGDGLSLSSGYRAAELVLSASTAAGSPAGAVGS